MAVIATVAGQCLLRPRCRRRPTLGVRALRTLTLLNREAGPDPLQSLDRRSIMLRGGADLSDRLVNVVDVRGLRFAGCGCTPRAGFASPVRKAS